MNNADKFSSLISDCLQENPMYKSELNNFKKYLIDRMILEKAFNLNETHIDEYFVYSYDAKIGSVPTLTSHIAALKALFSFLMKCEYDFKRLNGYINTQSFKDRLSEKLSNSISKQVLHEDLIRTILVKIDNKISEDRRSKLKESSELRSAAEIQIVRIFIKFSLLLPLKVTQILKLRLAESILKDGYITHNGIDIKLSRSFVYELEDTIEFFYNNYSVVIKAGDELFSALFGGIKSTANSSNLSSMLTRTYKNLNIKEMLKKQKVGKKNLHLYPAECYKKTALNNLVDNGTNLIYLRQLTGLDMNSIVSNNQVDNKRMWIDIRSVEINSGLVNTSFYNYI